MGSREAGGGFSSRLWKYWGLPASATGSSPPEANAVRERFLAMRSSQSRPYIKPTPNAPDHQALPMSKSLRSRPLPVEVLPIYSALRLPPPMNPMPRPVALEIPPSHFLWRSAPDQALRPALLVGSTALADNLFMP